LLIPCHDTLKDWDVFSSTKMISAFLGAPSGGGRIGWGQANVYVGRDNLGGAGRDCWAKASDAWNAVVRITPKVITNGSKCLIDLRAKPEEER